MLRKVSITIERGEGEDAFEFRVSVYITQTYKGRGGPDDYSEYRADRYGTDAEGKEWELTESERETALEA